MTKNRSYSARRFGDLGHVGPSPLFLFSLLTLLILVSISLANGFNLEKLGKEAGHLGQLGVSTVVKNKIDDMEMKPFADTSVTLGLVKRHLTTEGHISQRRFARSASSFSSSRKSTLGGGQGSTFTTAMKTRGSNTRMLSVVRNSAFQTRPNIPLGQGQVPRSIPFMPTSAGQPNIARNSQPQQGSRSYTNVGKKLCRGKRGVQNSVSIKDGCEIRRDPEAESKFQNNPTAYLVNSPVSTYYTGKLAQKTGTPLVSGNVYNFGLSKSSDGKAHTIYPLAKGDAGGIPATWLGTYDKISIDPAKSPPLIVTPELQGCSLYAGCEPKTGKMNFFHHYKLGKGVPDAKAQIQKINLPTSSSDGPKKVYKITHADGDVKTYTDVLKYKDYGMTGTYMQQAKNEHATALNNPNHKTVYPLVHATPIIYNKPGVNQWTFGHGKIAYPRFGAIDTMKGVSAVGGGEKFIQGLPYNFVSGSQTSQGGGEQ